MTLNLSLAKIAGWLRQLGSLASIVIGAAGTGGLPLVVRAVLIGAGAVLQAVEHHNAGKLATAALPPAVPAALADVAKTMGAFFDHTAADLSSLAPVRPMATPASLHPSSGLTAVPTSAPGVSVPGASS